MTFVRLFLAILCSLGLSGAWPAWALEGEVRRATVELKGPIDEPIFFDVGSSDVLRIDFPLRSGESRRFELLLPRGGGLEPILLAGAGEGVRFSGFEDLRTPLSPGLRARAARPSLAAGSEGGGPLRRSSVVWISFSGALLLAGMLLLRGRSWSALALGALAALGLALFGGGERSEPVAVRVEDGHAGEPWRVVVESGYERLAIPAQGPGAYRLGTRPAARPVLWTLFEDAAGEARLELEAPGARIDLSLAVEGGAVPSTLRNPGPTYAEAWTRDARGAWRAHGVWPEGQPLPSPREENPRRRPAVEREALPTWLVTGLPQGRSVLVLRERGPGLGGSQRWRRWTGL